MIRVDVRDEVDERALDVVWAWFERVDDLFSAWRDDSEICRLARGELARSSVSPEVGIVLERCEALKLVSQGAFDIGFAADTGAPSRPGQCAIDPTGLVKGWAVDRAADLLRERGCSNFAINAGGDILVRGRPAPGAVWRIGIQHPWQRDCTAQVVGVIDCAVATSGGYERGDHVIDPRTGRAASGLASVTVVAADLETADGYATAALALGVDGMPWLATRSDAESFGITDDGRVLETRGFDRLVVR